MNNEYRPRSWIFQISPKYYEIRKALGAGKPDYWSVEQHPGKIHTGDRVYIWETGPGPVILATAMVVGEPFEPAEGILLDQFVKTPEKFQIKEKAVKIRIEKILDIPITRKWLKKHPVLTWLQILRNPDGANFPVTPEQNRVLRRAIVKGEGGGDAPPPGHGRGPKPNRTKLLAKNAKQFLKKIGLATLKRRGILFKMGSEYQLKAASVDPLIVLMKEQGISRLEYSDRNWYLNTDYRFNNPRCPEKVGNVNSLKSRGNVFLRQNKYINPFFHHLRQSKLTCARKKRGRSQRKPVKGKNKKRSWFFRVSPNIYDIQEALKAGKPDCWPVRQYESEIHTGDRVYIWKSGNGAEILATAIVESEPLEVSGISERSPFMKKPEIFNRHGLVVNLQIENVLDRPITRKWLKKHPVLTWLQILRLSSCGSDYNFAVTPEQDRVLCREIRQRKIGSIPPPSSSGKSRDPKKVKIRTRNIKRFLKKTGFRELVKRRVLLKVSNEYRLKAGSVEPIIVLMRDQGIDRLEYPKRGWYLTTGYEFRNPESMENIRKVKMLKRKNNVFLNQNEYINPFYHGMLAAPHPTGERKQQKPVGAPIEERVKNLEKVVKHIYRQIDKMVQYQDSDPAASLAKARVVAETVCKQIYVNEGLEKGSRPAGRMMLEELLKALNQHHALPRQIHLSLLTIQYFGNFGAHDQGEESWEITDNSVKSCFHALVNVVSWYFKKYKGLKFEMPTSV